MDDERRFRVFVAGHSWRSQQVVQALHDLCAAHGVQAYDVEIVDLAERPELAEEYGVLALPMVMRVSPHPPVRVIGDLRDTTIAAEVLGLSGGQAPHASTGREETTP